MVSKYNLPVEYHNVPIYERRLVREQYIKEHKNLCMWCCDSLSKPPHKRITDLKILWRKFPKYFLKYPIHLQHCHKTGLTEGAVHAYCNAVLCQYEGR